MKQADLILQHWEEQQVVFSHNLSLVRRRPMRKASHDMRVSIKKLRSCLQLCNELIEPKEKKELNSVLLLFRVAGKHRDVEISIIISQRHLKKDNVCVPSFLKILRSHFRLSRNRTHEVAQAPHEKELVNIHQWIQESLSAIPDNELTGKVDDLVTKKIEELKKLVKDFSENAHEIRKLLKQLYYWVKYCSLKPVFNKTGIKILDKALICLGDAQDYIVLQNKLKDFRKEYLVKTTDEYDSAKLLENICKESREKLLKEAEKKTTELFGN